MSRAGDWFGPQLERLHPALQALHRDGGCLEGPVRIALGRGLAGWFGRRVARSLGVPLDRGEAWMRVRITHVAGAMHWGRAFDGAPERASVFTPVGCYPDGYWLEQSGATRLRLTVAIEEGGGWCWQLRAARIGLLPLPALMRPRLRACKRIDAQGAYRFEVDIAWPGLGTLLHYEGVLHPMAATASPLGVAPA